MITDLLDMACSSMEEVRERISGMTKEEQEKIGQVALEIVGDYPLYGVTSNISYDEAIMTALVLEGDDFVSRFDTKS